MVFYCFNEALCSEVFFVKDIGGSIYIHTFGGVFGLAATLFFESDKAEGDSENCRPNYYSAVVALVGTFFMYSYWPSFNSALATFPSEEHRAIINTILALCGSVIATVIFSRLISNYLNILCIAFATIAGGVAIGASANLIHYPYMSIIIGFLAGGFATTGYLIFAPLLLESRFEFHDTRGIQYLHVWAGLIGTIASVVSCAMAEYSFDDRYDEFFYVRADEVARGHRAQASYQLAAYATSIGVALLGGVFTGFICKCGCFEKLENLFDDRMNFH